MITITDVAISNPTLTITQSFVLRFKVNGAQAKAFTFPFSNESLTENLIQFIKEEE